MPGYKHRNMYNLTGLPGWMRLGYSPGWVGRSPGGLGPCAQYLMSGQWPNPQTGAYWQQVQTGAVPAGISPEQQVQILKNQSQMLSQQLEQINSRIAELENQD